jgi:hypothetical protein
MRRKLLIALFGISLATTMNAQVSIVFRERFDGPSGPDSVTTYNTNSLLNSAWNDTTNLQVSPAHSFHTKIVPFDSVIFETNTFSTLNKPYVRLKFNQICKIHFGQRGYIQASNDGGTTWVTLTGTNYQGQSPQFNSVGYFNELSYPAPSLTPYWGGQSLSASSLVPPTNQWWALESFDLTPILGGTNGYANCKLRFIASHQVNIPVSPSGWYLDNIVVEASTCELEEPSFTYNVTPYGKPVGARYLSNEALRLKARDFGGYNQGVDSVVVWWRLNGGAWQNANMTALTGAACPDSSIYTYNFSNVLLGDTVDWYVEIFDCACPNLRRDPIQTSNPNYYTFWRDPAPPAICGATYPNSFPLVVSPLPFEEDFESAFWQPGTGTGNTGISHRGVFPTNNPPTGQNWTVAPNATQTGFAWSVRTGPTATLNTGPSGDNTQNGTRYLYTEASQGAGITNTQLITPCIDLQNVSCAALEFYYHMYGQHIDLMRVDIDTGTATSKYVNNVWSRVGQQNVNENDPYKKAYISLEQFSGDIIRIRFVGRKNTTTTQDKNDMAIDDITVFEPVPVDVEMVNYLEPENGYCSYSNAEIVKAKLQSLGCLTLTSIPVTCKIEYTNTTGSVTTSFLYDTLGGTYSLGKDTTFTFGHTADLSGYGTYKMWVWSDHPTDTVNGNDTVGPYTIEHFAPLSTFPYIEDFDDPSTIPGNGTAGNTGVLGPNITAIWEPIPAMNSGSFAWMVKASTTPSAATGPISDYSGKGNYLYTEGNFGTAPVSAQLVSECVSLVGMTNPVIDFRYYMYGSDIGALAVQIVPAGSNSWLNVNGNLITNTSANNHSDAKSAWKYWSINLSNYAGQVIKFRILGQKTGLGAGADIGIDDLRIYDKISTDVGVEHIAPPGVRINLANPVAPTFFLRNYGTSAVNNIPITYTITPLCGPSAGQPTTYNATFTGSIPAGGTATYSVPASSMPAYPVGSFEICASTGKTGDTYAWNDSYCVTSVGWPEIPIQTGFAEDFDACNEGNSSGFWNTGDYLVFKIGTPPAGAGSAPNSYTTKLFGTPPSSASVNIYPNTTEYVNAPKFIGFDTIVGAQFWFKHRFSFGSGDAGLVEIFNQGTWIPLGFQDPDNAVGINWFNSANVPAANSGSAWTGSSASLPNTAGWVTSMWPLNIYNFSSNPLIARWKLIGSGGGTSEWSIDDVEIRIPPQNSASPVFVDTKEYIPVPDRDNTLRVRIQNTGAKLLDTCQIQFSTTGPNGTYSNPQLVVFNPPLPTGRTSLWVLFDTPWTQPASGTYNVCVVTSRPNNKQDNLTSDDTTCLNIIVPDKIVFSATDTGYCNNFDDPSITEWIALNWPDKQGLLSWEKGSPNQAPLVGAHSAPNAWMTNLTNNYRQRDSSSLFTPFFQLDSGQVYEFSFWHDFKTELYHDGGSVDFSFDGWETFQTVGYVLPDSNWFNTTHVTSLDILRPGWSGESNGWEYSTIKVAFEAADSFDIVQFRFRFGSDQSFEYQGWAIDDFCFSKSNEEAEIFIGVDEDDLSGALAGIGNVIPNPTTGETMIPYIMNDPANVRVTIYSMIGQQLLNFEQTSNQGINQIKFDVSGWSPGMYIVAIEVDGQQTTRKVIVR